MDDQFTHSDSFINVESDEDMPSGIRTVKPVNYKADRKREHILVADVEDPLQVWLINCEDVPGDEEFDITDTELALSAKPYDFTKELKQVMPTIQDVLCVFWLKGIVTLDDLSDTQRVRNALAHVAPSAASFTKFTKEV